MRSGERKGCQVISDDKDKDRDKYKDKEKDKDKDKDILRTPP